MERHTEMGERRIGRTVAAALVLALSGVAAAASVDPVPMLINYQGKLTNADGTLFADGTYGISFRVYDAATGGNVIWGRTYDVAVSNGQFNVILGASGGTALMAAVNNIGFAFSEGDRYIGITVETDGTGTPLASPQEILPRQQILSAPYALTALHGVPPGTVLPYAGAAELDQPKGFVPCDGRELSRSDYADLFTAIGTTWGEGDGASTFNVPDLRGRTTIGSGQGSGLSDRTLGETSGEEAHTLTESEMPSHTHGVTDPGHIHTFPIGDGDAGSRDKAADGDQYTKPVNTDSATTGITIDARGGGVPHNNMQPSAVVSFIIKY